MTFSKKVKTQIKSHYNSNLVEEFYKPTLSEANLYKRVSGYFSTAGLDLYIDGLEDLAKNDGKVYFIISKEISKSDYEKIKSGYDLRKELKKLKLAERNEILNPEAQKKLGNLAFMIASGHARIKIALTEKGIFHDKFGLIYSEEEKIFFNGSANETRSGINSNYESISVDVSWDSSENVQDRILSNEERFNRLWNNIEPDVLVLEASEVAYEEVAKYQVESDICSALLDCEDTVDVEIPENTIVFKLIKNTIVRIDNTISKITDKDRKLKKNSDLFRYFESDNSTINSQATYRDIEKIIEVTTIRAKRHDIQVIVSDLVNEFLVRNKYSIENYKILGNVYKGELVNFPIKKQIEFEKFTSIVQSEVSRSFYDSHLHAAYYQYEMIRAANFSVPGSGKTAMILGVFAYLNSSFANQNEKVDRILVISPLNAFESWKKEFKEVFGDKKQLNVIDSQNGNKFMNALNMNWGISNLVLVNYESLPSYANLIDELIDSKTMLVFDEVHRIKNPESKRAKVSLDISKKVKFRYVLTGTPIPNAYLDVYNFLNILYFNEYNTFFGWDTNELKNPSLREINEINKRMFPFFWRTNKKDLKVPDADEDILIIESPSKEQLVLAENIYYNESSSFAKLIRLMQASTNPSLLKQNINYEDLTFGDEDSDKENDLLESQMKVMLSEEQKINYSSIDLDHIITPKFSRGIDLVCKLVSENKKVLVWGVFVGTLKKIKESLENRGISVNLVYGGTDKSERSDLIDEFRHGNIDVLISNPKTLGESISLHKYVHDAVYFEYDFNLTSMLQSRDRIHRLGLDQNQYTRYYYLQTRKQDYSSNIPGFIDEKIYKRLKEKEKLMYESIDNDELLVNYSEQDILDAIAIVDEERERIYRK